MTDKTALEIDIEHLERNQIPGPVKVLIVLLLIGIIVLGGYALTLKREIAEMEQAITTMKKDCQKEKTDLLSKIKLFETVPGSAVGIKK